MTGERRNITILFFVWVCVVIFYLPGISDGFYTLDDLSLVDIPVFHYPFDAQTLWTLFTPGWHIDFYPIRDLSYAIDVYAFGASTNIANGFIFRMHNFVLFLLSALLLYKILSRYHKPGALLLTLFWILNPYHAEILMWISARKDILAIFFFLLSVLLFQKKCFLLSVGSFLLSLLSKATFGLVPALGLIYFYFKKPRQLQRQRLASLGFMLALGLASSIFQSWFYTVVHDMRMNYEWGYRLKASLAALGRMAVGLLAPTVNAIDTDNWGMWLEWNKQFIPIGIFVIIIFLGLLMIAFRQKNWGRVFILIALVLLYIPISGLIFPHRQFYSVRYFEPVFLGLIFYFSTFNMAKYNISKYKYLLYFFFATMSILAWNESKNWHSSLAAESKELKRTPENTAVQSIHLAGLINNLSNLSDAEKTSMQAIQKQLVMTCEHEILPSRNGHSCINYWLQFGSRSKTHIESGIKVSLSDSNLLQLSSKNFDPSYKRRQLKLKIQEPGYPDPGVAKEALALPSMQITELDRIYIGRYLCFLNNDQGTNYLRKLVKNKTVRKQGISQLMAEAHNLKKCLFITLQESL